MAEWQTHRTQNAAGNHAGSSPATGTTACLKRIFRQAILCVLIVKIKKAHSVRFSQHIADLRCALTYIVGLDQNALHSKIGLCSSPASAMNMVIMDVRIVDPTMHQQYTGVDNGMILANLRALCN